MKIVRIFALGLAVLLPVGAMAGSDEEEGRPWVEADLALPAYPADADLVEFNVSAATTNKYFIDSKSISVGSDGVVRYSLVILTSGGATNVTYEGIRCSAREFRAFAIGRSDRTWSPSRLSTWKPIENKPINRHHAALSHDFFCPRGVPIYRADDGRKALRRGIHPDAEDLPIGGPG
jgi:hypothetical protein